MRVLAGKALRWKIADGDGVSLEWVSLVEGAFPLTDSNHWDLAIQTRVQVRISQDFCMRDWDLRFVKDGI